MLSWDNWKKDSSAGRQCPEVRTIAVIGAGTVGRGIAQLAALGGYRTILEDFCPTPCAGRRVKFATSLIGPWTQAGSTVEAARPLSPAWNLPAVSKTRPASPTW